MDKYLRFLMIFLVLLFSIGLVSATEENNLITEDVMEVDEINDLNVETVNKEESIKNAAGDVYNFTWLDNEIYKNGTNDATIDLDESTVRWNITDSFTNGITINKTVTIKNGIIDGNNSARIFNVSNTGNLILQDIILVNGTADNGGVIYNNGGIVIIHNGTFTENNAASEGGVIYNLGTVTINNGTFTENNAASDGGVIYNNGYLTINNGNFTQNTATSRGGVIHTLSGTVIINNGTFNNNTATVYYGGVIYNGRGTVTINNGTFNNNTAGISGGVIHTFSGTVIINNGTFTENTANDDGGVIYNDRGTVTINNGTFNNNTANSGGVIYTWEWGGTVTIENGTFNNNTANSGGVIYNSGSGTVTIYNGNFTNNSASNIGGVIYNNGYCDVINSTFLSNNASIGGAIHSVAALVVLNSTFKYNSAKSTDYGGGAICIDTNVNVYINGNVFEFNTGTYGSAILNFQRNTILSNNTFKDNSLNHLIFNYENAILFLHNNTMNNDLNIEKIFNNGTIISMIVLRIMNNNTVYGEDVVLNATLKDDKSNIIVGQNITLTNPILGNITLSDINAGVYSNNYFVPSLGIFLINGSYLGGDNLTIQMGLLKNKINTTINVTVENVTFNESVIIKYNLTHGATGNISVIVKDSDNNPAFSGIIDVGSDGIAYLGAGEYTVFLTYTGDSEYNSSSNFTTFTVYKASTSINVDVGNITFGDNLTVDYLVNSNVVGITGNVTIIVRNLSGVVYNKTFMDTGNITEIPNLNAGNYLLNITYNGNANYSKSSIVQPFTVYKASTSINVDLDNITFGDNLTVNYSVISNVVGIITGNVTMIVRNSSGIVFNKTFLDTGNITEIPNLNSGNYLLNITYNGEDNYNKSNKVQSFTVYKASTNIDVDVGNITFGDNLTVDYSVNSNTVGTIIGNVTIIVSNSSGVIYNKTFIDTGNITEIPNLNSGNYLLNITYNGENNYNKSNKVQPFTVYKASTNIVLNVDNITFGDNLTVDYSVNSNTVSFIIGNVTIIVSNSSGVIYNKTFMDTGNITEIPNLNAGNYLLNITYNGEDNYNKSSKVQLFSVYKASTNIDVDVDNITFGDNLTVNYNVNSNTVGTITGNITVIIKDSFNVIYNRTFLNLSDIIIIPNLNAGMYDISVTYNGDDNYLNSSFTSVFEVFKLYSNLVFNVTNVTYGDYPFIRINLTIINGDLLNTTIIGRIQGINSVFYVPLSFNLTNGYYEGLLSNGGDIIPAGIYMVLLNYYGDNYEDASNDTIFEVFKSDITVNISEENMVYGENQTIKITVDPDLGGNITLIHNNNEIEGPVNNTEAIFSDLGFNPGNYNITVYYPGNRNYNDYNQTIIITISKSDDNNLAINDSEIVYSDNETIVITVNPELTGNVTVVIGNETITDVPIINGTIIISGLNLLAGNQSLRVIYPGDNNYLPFTETITVNIAKSDDNNLALNNSEIVYSDNETIVITVNPELTGTVTVVIGDETIADVPIINGTITIPELNLPAGNHSLEIIYPGDDNFNGFNITVNLTVLKSNKTDIVVEDVNITANENQTLVIDINPDATGNMTLTINGTDYIAPIINGTVRFPIDFNPGNYNGTIIYTGDDNFNGFNTTVSFNIFKSDVLLNASDIFMFYRDGTRYVAVLTDTLDNPIFNQTIYITVNGVTYKRETNINGTIYLNLNLLPKEYNVTAYYNGSAKYNNASITTKLIINSTIITDNFVKYYRNGTQYQITVLDTDGKPLANQSVEFNINGMKYTRISDSNGIVTLSINLYPGNYTITATYNGLNLSNNIEVLPTLIGKDLTKNFGASEQYEVTVLDGNGKPLANQNVTINIHGVFYICLSDSNGIARLNINLNPGTYTATSTWNGYSTSNTIRVV